MEVAVGSEPGIWQRRNLEAHVAESIAPAVSFLGVADGFGSVGRAVPIAQIALSLVRDYLRRKTRGAGFGGRNFSANGIRQLMLGALSQANARLYALSGSHDDFVSGGASLTGVLVAGHHACVAHVGGGRAYLRRYDRLESLTVDDALSTEGVPSTKTGLPSKPFVRSLLWRTLGTQSTLEASIAYVELLAGDELVVCTDGIHRNMLVEEISETLAHHESASDAVAQLLQLCRERGNAETGTVILGRDLLTPVIPVRARRRAGFGGRGLLATTALLIAAVIAGMLVYSTALRYF